MAKRAKDIGGPTVKQYGAEYNLYQRGKCNVSRRLFDLEMCPDSPEKTATMQRLKRQKKEIAAWFFAYYEAEARRDRRLVYEAQLISSDVPSSSDQT